MELYSCKGICKLKFHVVFVHSLDLRCLVLCPGHSTHSFVAIQLSCFQETSEKMWNVVVKVSLRKIQPKILKEALHTSCKQRHVFLEGCCYEKLLFIMSNGFLNFNEQPAWLYKF